MVATTSNALGSLGALAVVLAIGLAIGVINGWLVAVLGLQSLAATIGSMFACEGVALLILSAPGGEVADAIANGLTGDVAGLFPVAGVVIAGLLLAWALFARTRIGIAIYAVGADENAARLSGLVTSLRATALESALPRSTRAPSGIDNLGDTAIGEGASKTSLGGSPRVRARRPLDSGEMDRAPTPDCAASETVKRVISAKPRSPIP